MTFIELLFAEMNRCREVLKEYENIGDAGVFGRALIKQSIKRAERAIQTDDAVAMLAAYKDLQKIEQ